MKTLIYTTLPIRLVLIITILLGIYYCNFYNGDDKYVFEGYVTSLDIIGERQEKGDKMLKYVYTYKDEHNFEYSDSLKTKYGEYNFIIENLKENNKVYTENEKCTSNFWFPLILIELVYSLLAMLMVFMFETEEILLFMPFPIYFMTDTYQSLRPYNGLYNKIKSFFGR